MGETTTPSRDARRAQRRPAPRRSAGRGRLLVFAVFAVLATVAVVAAVLVVGGRGDDSPTTATAGDAGRTGPDFHSLVVDPTSPGRIFVGGHQAVSVSENDGRSWRPVDSLDDADAMGWSFVDGAVYVSGHPGINRSDDGALTFRRTNDGLPDTDIHAFGATGSTLYAAGPNVGVLASTDGGTTWERRTTDAGQAFFGRIIAGPGENHLVAADARTGAVQSTDGGRSWRPLGGPAGAVWVSRSGPVLYVSTQEGVARTSDGGGSWEAVTVPNGASLVEADPAEPTVLYAGTHAGDSVTVQVSRDGGNTWSRP